MWYQKIRKLKIINTEENEILFIDSINKLKLASSFVDSLIINRETGRVIKKIYIPDNLCVIDEKADIGSLIFLKSI